MELVQVTPNNVITVTENKPIDNRKVITEEKYVSKLEKIIQRDFFPHLPLQELQRDYLLAQKNEDFQRAREILLQFNQMQKDIKENKRESSEDDKKKLSIDEFHGKHVSEDNKSFSQIMETEDKIHKKKKQCLFNPSNATQQLQLETSETRDKNSVLALGWHYKPKNDLMFFPDGINNQIVDENEFSGPPKEILAENTRLGTEGLFAKPAKIQANKNQSEKEQFESLFSSRYRDDGKKIDLEQLFDQNYGKNRSSPPIGNYEFVATPAIVPGSAGENEIEASFITYGTIQSTPQIISNSTPMVGYQLPPTPARERVALELTEKHAKRLRPKKEITKKIASGNIKFQKSPFTPYASSPSTITPHRHSFGYQLQKSYQSPAITPRRQTKTPVKLINVTPVRPKVNLNSTGSNSTSTSITDNLLKI